MSKEMLIFLLNELPKYITLFYPGYLTIYLYFFFSGKSFKDSSWIIAKTVCISYFYNVMCENFLKAIGRYSEINMNITLVSLAIIIGIVAAKIRDSKRFDGVLTRIKDDTVFLGDEFEILRNEDRSAWVCIYLKNSNIVYEGSLREVNLDTNNEKYICLSGYYKYMIDEDGKPIYPYIVNVVKDNEEKVVIHYSDIGVIEKRNTN